MNSITLEELKDFESSAKREIILTYMNIIPKSKVDAVLQKEYVSKENFNENKPIEKQYGDLLRKIFKDYINIDKEYNDSFVEYYSMLLASKLHVSINERPDLKNKVKVIVELYEKLGEELHMMVFNNREMELLNIIKNNENNGPSLNLVYKDSVQYIEYVDKEKVTHLVKTNDPDKISKEYKKLMKKEKDLEKIFNKLVSLDEEALEHTTNEEVNMTDYINPKKDEAENIMNEVSEAVSSNEMDFDEFSKTLKDDEMAPIKEDEYVEELQKIDEVNNENESPMVEDETVESEIEESVEENTADDIINSVNEEMNDDTLENENIEEELPESEEVPTIEPLDEPVLDDTPIEEVKNVEQTDEDGFVSGEIHSEEDNQAEEQQDEAIPNNDVESETYIEEPKEVIEKRDYLEEHDDSNENEELFENNDKKESITMIFYILAIVISLSLIIGILLLKYYS